MSAPVGIGYAAAWTISLSVRAPNPSVAASGSQVASAFAGRSAPGLAMFALAEGVAAIALVAVMTAAARAARCCGQARAGLAAAFGIPVAAVSWAQAGPGHMADQRTGPGPDRHCRGHIPRDHADGRGEDVPAGRDGSGHLPAGPAHTHPASLAGPSRGPAGSSPGDVRGALPSIVAHDAGDESAR
jgi:hypothetical protein